MDRAFHIDDEESIAFGSCAETCPHCFRYEVSKDVAQVFRFDCPENDIREAMDICPVQCIHRKGE